MPSDPIPASIVLTGERRRHLHEALLAAFVNQDDLARMLSFRMDVKLQDVLANRAFADQVFELIEWTEAHGRLEELVASAVAEVPANPQLRQFLAEAATAAPRSQLTRSLSKLAVLRRRVGAWPLLVRLLAMVVAVAGIAAFVWGVSALTGWNTGTLRAAFGGTSHVPLSSATVRNAGAMVPPLAVTLEPELSSPEKTELSAWVASQETMAAYGVTRSINSKSLAAYMRTQAEAACSCWREFKGAAKPYNIFISGWVFLAFAELGESATHDEIAFLLNEQQPDGWWSVFPVATDSKYASSYGTAWVLLGLQAQLARGLTDSNDTAPVQSAISRGASWLLAHRESRSRWKDYPLVQNGKISESISGLALHALHAVIPQTLKQIDAEWLNNLPESRLAPDDSDNPYIYFKTRDNGWVNDDYVQIRLPWLLIGTADAYANGSLTERGRALVWMERALRQPAVAKADTTPDNWWRSELLYSIRYLLRAATPPK